MALVVETGSGLADANSYGSIEEADGYFSGHPEASSWSALTDAEKEFALQRATLYIESGYGRSWLGIRKTSTQALSWPRYSVVTPDGKEYSSETLPTELVTATFEAALRQVTETEGLLPTLDTERGLEAESVEVGPIRRYKKYSGSQANFKKFSAVEALLSQITLSRFEIMRG